MVYSLRMQRSIQQAVTAAASIGQASPFGPAEHSDLAIGRLLRQTPLPARQLLAALAAAQARHALFMPEQPLLVAVSGGADSICLLHLLHQLAPHWQLALHVAHLDHALRPESAGDAAFVAEFAQQLGLPLTMARLTPGIVDDDPRGPEAAARSARYAFLRQVAASLGAPVTIATAHHQDDQAETLLLHLIQGSGLHGLAGMAWVGNLPDNLDPALRLVRPLLAIDRSAIHSYLRAHGLAWREDASNNNLAHPRNRLRHEILPALAAINPNIHATLARSAELLAAEAEHATARDQRVLTILTIEHLPQTRLVLDLFRLAEYDLATQRGTLRQALLALGIDLRDTGMEGIDRLLAQPRTFKASGPHTLLAGWVWTLLRSDNSAYLALHRAATLPAVVEHPHLGLPLLTPRLIPTTGTLTHGEWELHSRLISPDELPNDWRSRQQPWRLFCDAKACGELLLTTPQPGMQITPLGMNGHHRTLGNIFTDRKIAPYLRPGWPLVTSADGRPVWLCGLTVADPVRFLAATRQVRVLEWRRVDTPEATP